LRIKDPATVLESSTDAASARNSVLSRHNGVTLARSA
jgi:hypothetical protein